MKKFKESLFLLAFFSLGSVVSCYKDIELVSDPQVSSSNTSTPTTPSTPSTPVTYTVTWKLDDSTTLEVDTNVTSGTKPSFDQGYEYYDYYDDEESGVQKVRTKTIAGWATTSGATSGTKESDLPAVTSNVTYYAVLTDFINAAVIYTNSEGEQVALTWEEVNPNAASWDRNSYDAFNLAYRTDGTVYMNSNYFRDLGKDIRLYLPPEDMYTETKLSRLSMTSQTPGDITLLSFMPSLDDDSSATIYSTNLPNLKELIIGKKVTEVGEAFKNNPNLKTVRFAGTVEELKNVTFNASWLGNNSTNNTGVRKIMCTDGEVKVNASTGALEFE